MASKMDPGHGNGEEGCRGLGRIPEGSGRWAEGRNSPAWWAMSAPRKMNVSGFVVVRARAQRWPIVCCFHISILTLGVMLFRFIMVTYGSQESSHMFPICGKSKICTHSRAIKNIKASIAKIIKCTEAGNTNREFVACDLTKLATCIVLFLDRRVWDGLAVWKRDLFESWPHDEAR